MDWREDKTLLTLCGFTVFFAILFALVAWVPPKDTAAFTVISGLLTGFSAALTLHLKSDKVPPAGSTTLTNTSQVIEIPKETKL